MVNRVVKLYIFFPQGAISKVIYIYIYFKLDGGGGVFFFNQRDTMALLAPLPPPMGRHMYIRNCTKL